MFDLVYVGVETGLLRAAKARGFQAIDELSMLIQQAAISLRKYFGAAAPRPFDWELRELLTQ